MKNANLYQLDAQSFIAANLLAKEVYNLNSVVEKNCDLSKINEMNGLLYNSFYLIENQEKL